MNLSPQKKGFSLIEILVVVSIIAILATLASYNLNSARVKGRDTKRISDMNTINLALRAYFNDHGVYPTSINFGQPFTNAAGTKTYIEQIPTNPFPRTDHNCPDREYVYRIAPTDDTSYSLVVCTGLDNNASKPRLTYSNEEGIFHCGDLITDLDNNYYKTVSIGSQCWMAQNLKTKTKPDGSCIMNNSQPPCPDSSIDDGYRGRTCWNFLESNCTWKYSPTPRLDGALYMWNAAMNGSTTEGAQGICPTGWHVPSDNDFYILESFLTDPGASCLANRIDPPFHYCSGSYCPKCQGSGTRLMYPGGTSGFNAILTGYYAINSQGYMIFWANNQNTRFITSTEQGSNYINRMFWPGFFDSIWRVYDSKIIGSSLRCVKD